MATPNDVIHPRTIGYKKNRRMNESCDPVCLCAEGWGEGATEKQNSHVILSKELRASTDNVTECEEACAAHSIMKDGLLGCSESHTSDDNAILNKLKSTQSKDCLILKLFRMTDNEKVKEINKPDCLLASLASKRALRGRMPRGYAEARNDERMSTNLTTDEEPHTRISSTRIARAELLPLPQGVRVSNKTVKNLTSYRPNVLTTLKNNFLSSPLA